MNTQEHIHDYESAVKRGDSSFALPFHTDRGLLLIVTHSKVLDVDTGTMQCVEKPRVYSGEWSP